MNKQEVFDYLDSKNIWYEVTEHQAVYNMEEAAKLDVPYPTANAKNLFVRDGKKRNYYLITTKADKQLDLKEFRNHNNTKRLSFASPDELMQILGLIPGAVTPLGLLNPTESNIEFFIDE
ncbi:YbaK/EbsC family protein [Lentilactobacillus senioris]|uniref:YbaK/EbsC family protein n=1 Tax=Lentilactobacillus senioris TaxID=931534 RepID=UPI003D2D88C6